MRHRHSNESLMSAGVLIFVMLVVSVELGLCNTTQRRIPLQKLSVKGAFQQRLKHYQIEHEDKEPIVNFGDMQYFGVVYVGSHRAEVRLQLDTGSSNTWLNSVSCTCSSNVSPLGQRCYPVPDVTESRTFKEINTPYSWSYGSGVAKGSFFSDTIEWAGVTIPSYQMGLTSNLVGRAFCGLQGAGILGLAFPPLADKGVTPIFIYAFNHHLIDTPIFAMNITNEPGSDGFLELGVKENVLPGVEWHSISSPIFWALNGHIRVGSVSFRGLLIIDSGTSLIAIPSLQLAQFYSEVGADSNGLIQASKLSSLPDLTIAIDWKVYTLTPEQYVLPGWSGRHGFRQLSFTSSPDDRIFILGDTFMSRTGHSVTLFDTEKQRIGLTGGTPRSFFDVYPPWQIALVLAFSLSLLLLGVFVYTQYRKKRNRRLVSERQPLLQPL